ncbi:cytochrome P450 [Pseudonocardia eucalypti]|uniref:Cytochrome P450 n=1 Tax=Pseudonocardia eucalypti TaxID=648755 RepID=A0ABP9PJS4_9PSEU|nr:cytochrome P450 [Pseudonocardia eucalypti]
MRLPDTARWAATHGLIRLVLKRELRRGNPGARLLTDPAVNADPYPYYEGLRVPEPFASGLAGGRITVHHAVATEVLRSDAMGTVAFGGGPRPLRAVLGWFESGAARSVIEPPSMLAVDPPVHSRYRKLVTRAFTVRAVNALRERTEQISTELLDELAKDGNRQVDLVRRYAAQLPVIVICEILGAPTSMREHFLRWGDDAATSLDPGMSLRQFHRAQEGIDALLDWLRGHFVELRRNPGEDILSQLVNAEDDDQLTETELLATALLVLAAGFETTVNLLGTGIALLDRHPEQRALLADRPELWPNAVDEMLRFDSPVQRTARRALRETEIAGIALEPEDFVVLLLGGANRDPRVFTDPNRFDITRENAGKHLSFSSGVHHCLGASLARMEGEVALRALYQRFPELSLVGAPQRRPTTNLRGYTSVPARLAAPIPAG